MGDVIRWSLEVEQKCGWQASLFPFLGGPGDGGAQRPRECGVWYQGLPDVSHGLVARLPKPNEPIYKFLVPLARFQYSPKLLFYLSHPCSLVKCAMTMRGNVLLYNKWPGSEIHVPEFRLPRPHGSML